MRGNVYTSVGSPTFQIKPKLSKKIDTCIMFMFIKKNTKALGNKLMLGMETGINFGCFDVFIFSYNVFKAIIIKLKLKRSS